MLCWANLRKSKNKNTWVHLTPCIGKNDLPRTVFGTVPLGVAGPKQRSHHWAISQAWEWQGASREEGKWDGGKEHSGLPFLMRSRPQVWSGSGPQASHLPLAQLVSLSHLPERAGEYGQVTALPYMLLSQQGAWAKRRPSVG